MRITWKKKNGWFCFGFSFLFVSFFDWQRQFQRRRFMSSFYEEKSKWFQELMWGCQKDSLSPSLISLSLLLYVDLIFSYFQVTSFMLSRVQGEVEAILVVSYFFDWKGRCWHWPDLQTLTIVLSKEQSEVINNITRFTGWICQGLLIRRKEQMYLLEMVEQGYSQGKTQ